MLYQPSDSAGPPPLSKETIQLHLEQILSTRQFATALRSRRFLTYVVEQTLNGRVDEIKESILGIEVFDRSPDFDPKEDAIVRVEAGKLRKRLQQYYEKEGAATQVRIEIPKGRYVPEFHVPVAPSAPGIQAGVKRRVRYLALPTGLLAVAIGIWWGVRHEVFSRPAEPSIAVLPFLNFSVDPSNEYLADGLAEDLTDALCRAGGMRVASRTSAFSFKGKQPDIHDIGARLGVEYVVEGSVRRQGDRLKVTAQLVRTKDGYHVWSGSFERQLEDVIAAQEETAVSVVSALRVRLSTVQERRLRKAHTANAKAFDLYLKGRHAAGTVFPADFKLPERLYREAIAVDPAYALPFVGLADLYVRENVLGERPAGELASKARQALQEALALDDELAEAHAILGSLTARHQYDWSAAEQHLRHALELNPNSATGHNELSQNVLAGRANWTRSHR